MSFGHPAEDLSAYLDGELDSLELLRVKGHISGCDHCREEVAGLMEVRARLRSLPMLELPASEAVHRRGAKVLRKPRLVWGTAAAAVAALAVALASFAAPREVVAITQDDLSAPWLARTSFDPSSAGRLIPPDVLSLRIEGQAG
ncbi:MAG TPA: zf-HC2 domain-containing protein [Acidimicrobiia bacterium]|nr:zf-HC2 domain-containing protein [Acidimicrobiia bacterium]